MLSSISHDAASLWIMLLLLVTVAATVIATLASIWLALRSMDSAEASSQEEVEITDCDPSAVWVPLFLYGEYSTFLLPCTLHSCGRHPVRGD